MLLASDELAAMAFSTAAAAFPLTVLNDSQEASGGSKSHRLCTP